MYSDWLSNSNCCRRLGQNSVSYNCCNSHSTAKGKTGRLSPAVVAAVAPDLAAVVADTAVAAAGVEAAADTAAVADTAVAAAGVEAAAGARPPAAADAPAVEISTVGIPMGRAAAALPDQTLAPQGSAKLKAQLQWGPTDPLDQQAK